MICLTEKVAQWLINCCLFKGLLGERGHRSEDLHCWFVCLFVKCILEFSDMHIQVMSNNVCQELHFNFFKILMFYTVVNIQVVMVMFKLSQRNLA